MKKSKKIALIILSAVLAVCLLGVVLFFGIFPACSKDVIPPEISTNVTTVRKAAPTDGSTPEDYGALDNVAFMAYVLDNQPAYHAYANNATQSIGYEQVTQSWKDYKSAALSGKNASVMVASDLSYSLLVRSATQSCFIGDGTAYMRMGSTPDKSSVATDIKWSESQPDYYTKDTYLKKYGEFSTELTVYVITEDTFIDATEVVNNGDGTYSQTLSLNSTAACWYQYGMKTRGGLKTFPEYTKITLTFTFDESWQVLETYCEEKAKIAPSVLGGMMMDSTSKTTTTFSYGLDSVDDKHYAYYPDFFDKYVGTITDNTPAESNNDPELLEVLTGGFGKVISESGQQFNLALTLGETEYTGKIYLKLADISVDALEVRLSLGKKDSGNQDFYLEYKDKVLNAYYSDGFALTADIDGVLASVNSFAEWIDGLRAKEESEWVEVSAQSSDELDLSSLLGALELSFDDSKVTISVNSDNLMELGVGVDLAMSFDRKILEDGNEYAFKEFSLNTVSLNGEKINISVGITPDDGEIISHEESQSPANLTEYLDGILALIKGDTFGVSIALDGSCNSIEYINGLELTANATVKLNGYSEVEVFVPVSVKYQNLTVELTAFYTVKLSGGDYGKVYLTLDKINGTAYGAKVYCDINEVVSTVKSLIGSGVSELSEESDGVAEIINLVLGLDFGSIIEELKADGQSLKVKINADEILTALNLGFGIDLGSIGLTVGLTDGKATFSAEAEEFGLTLGVVASDAAIPEINPEEYADILEYVNGVFTLLNAESYLVDITLDKGVTAHTTAQVAFDGSVLKVYAPVTASYEGLTVGLTVYYTINITSGGYGDVYITLTEINGASYNAKVCCNVGELINSVKSLIALFDNAPAEAVAYAVSDIVNIDFNSLITEIVANGEEIRLGVNADEVLTLLDVSLGIEIGSVTLKLTVDEGVLILSGEVPAFGLTLTLNGSDESLPEINPEEYADIVEYLDGLYNLLNAESYLIDITLDKGVTARTTAQLAFDGSVLKVHAPVTASYEGFTVGLTVYYTIDITSGGYGDVYITLTEINGRQFNAKVCCNVGELINSVKSLIALFDNAPAEAVAYAVSDIVNIDFNSLITEIAANGEHIKLGVNADEVLALLDVSLGMEIGSVTLKLTVDEGLLTLAGEVPAFGLTLTLNGSDEEITAYSLEGHLDAVQLVNLVEKAYLSVKDIIDEEDIVFDISVNAVVDGVEMIVDGRGEVIWKDGKIRVAVTADASITDIENGKNANTLTINFVYEENTVKLAVNKLGLEITQNDVTNLKDGLTQLLGRIENLSSAGSSAAPAAGYALTDNGGASLSAVIDIVLGALQNVTVELVSSDAGELKDLLIGYASVGKIQLGANDGLSLVLNAYDLAEVKAGVIAGNGSVIEGIKEELSKPEYKFYTDDEDFVHAVYRYVFAVLEDLTVDNALGNGTFEMDITLTGSESGISALDGINVNAKLYYTETTPKLITAEIAIDIKGTAVNAEVSYHNDYVFVNVTKVGETALDGIAFKASTEDIYTAAETIVRLAVSRSLFEVVERLTGGQSAQEAISAAALQSEEASQNPALTDILYAVLAVNFSEIIEAEELPNGEHTLTVKPDELLSALGLNISVGTVFLKSDPQRHTAELSVINGENPWLEIAAKVTNGGAHATIDQSKYIDIGFVAALLNDAENIINGFEDGKIVYSLNGSFNADISYSVVSATIAANNVIVTFGLDDDNELYVNITADLTEQSAKLGISLGSLAKITEKRTIGITYYKGYVTLGINVNSSTAQYRVMTLEYLLDNLFESNSPIQWLLGTSSTVWNILKGELKKQISVSSGLTKAQTLYLYELAKVKTDGTFYLSSILNGFAVSVNGINDVYKTGDKAVNALGLSANDSYYALDINASGLTGGAVSALYAAIVRDADGISGVKAYAAISTYVTINVNLSTTDEISANHFSSATDGKDIDFDYSQKVEGQHVTSIFGCYNTADGSYGYSDILDEVTLNVIDLYGETESYILRYGSSVYLTNMWAPEWTNDSKQHTVYYTDVAGNRVGDVFTDAEGNVLGWVLTLEEGLFDSQNSYTIYIRKDEASVLKKEIIYHTGIDGIGDVGGAFEVQADGTVNLINYEVEEYLLFGMFFDEDKTNPITSDLMNGFDGTDVYCTYIKSTVTVNGVVYKLYDENGTHVYHVSTFDANGILPYTESGTTLTLENEIVLNGVRYPVTQIDASALKSSLVKNVIVPEKITVIGAQAFMDNYAIESVVFLAEKVTLGGNSYSGDNRYVFYGCSISDSEKSSDYTSTKLVLYYNQLSGSGDWDCFRYDNGIAGWGAKTYRVSSYSGAWTYVEYSVNSFKTMLTELTTGIYTSAIVKEDVESYVVKTLNELTAPDGYVNKYSVTVTVENVGVSHQQVTVTITENDKSEWKYLNELTLKSAVAYTYDGTPVGAGEDYIVTIENDTVLSVPVAEGYTFLGYAYATVAGYEGLTFAHCDLSANAAKDDVYYLIWAVNRDAISVVSVTEDGNIPAAESVTATEGSFYGWYTDETFATKVDAITVSNTVLYARMSFTLTFSFSYSNSTFFYANNNGTNAGGNNLTYSVYDGKFGSGSNNQVYNYTLVVLEGSNVKISVDSNNCVLTATMTDVDGSVTYWSIRGYKGTTIYSGSTKRTFIDSASHPVTYSGGVWYNNAGGAQVENDVAGTIQANAYVYGNMGVALSI